MQGNKRLLEAGIGEVLAREGQEAGE